MFKVMPGTYESGKQLKAIGHVILDVPNGRHYGPSEAEGA